jgi:ABC-2 type transport system permease protein
MGRALRSTLVRALGFFLVLEAMLIPAVVWWPEFAKNVKQLRAMAPLPVMRDLVDQLEQGGVFAYVTGQHFFKGCNTLGTAAAVLMAVGAVAGEAHRGTLEIWLARPLSRTRILTERFVAGALGVAVPVVATTLTIPFLLEYVGTRLDLAPLLLSAVHESLLLVAIYAIAFFLSTISRAPLGIAFGMLFFTIFQFAIYLVEKLTHWSIFRLADVERFLDIQKTGTFDLRVVSPLAAAVIAAYIASLIAFRRRTP